MEISQKIQQLRKEAGLSQEGLAERMGLSRQAVSKWESGAAIPTLDNLMELSRLLEVPVGELLQPGGEENAPEAGAEAAGTGPQPQSPPQTLSIDAVRELLAATDARERASRRRVLWLTGGFCVLCALCALACGAGFFHLNGQVSGLRGQLEQVDSRADGIGSDVRSQLGSLTADLREQFQQQDSLTADYGWEVLEYDHAARQVTLLVTAVPKADTPDMAAAFSLAGEGMETISAPGERDGSGGFSARLTAKPLDTMKLSVSFTTPDGQTRNQLLEVVYGLRAQYQMRTATAFDGRIWVENDALILDGPVETQVEPAFEWDDSSGRPVLTNWPVSGQIQVWVDGRLAHTQDIDIGNIFSPQGTAPDEAGAPQPDVTGSCGFYTYLENLAVPAGSSGSAEIRSVLVDNFGEEQASSVEIGW